MRRHRQEPLLKIRYFCEKSLEPPAGEAAEPGGHQCLGAIGISLVMGQSEEIPGGKKPRDLPPAIPEELIDLHCTRGDGMDIFCGISLIEYRAMRRDIDGAHDCCKALLFLCGQWGTRRKLACSTSVAGRDEMQRMGTGSNSHAEPRHRVSRVISGCRAMHRITPAVSLLPRRCHRSRGRILPPAF